MTNATPTKLHLARAALFAGGLTYYLQLQRNDRRGNSQLDSWRGMSATRCASDENHNSPPKLVQAHVIFRHGARTPVFYTPKLHLEGSLGLWSGKCAAVNTPPGVDAPHLLPPLSPDEPRQAHVKVVHHRKHMERDTPRPTSAVDSFQLKRLFGECRQGQLTDLGAQQSSDLGKELVRRYQPLYRRAKEEKRLWVRTSNVARCTATLAYVLGEFEREDGTRRRRRPEFDDDEPVEVQTAPAHEEFLYPNGVCALTAQLMNAAKVDWRRNPDPRAAALVEELKTLLPHDTFEALQLHHYNFVRIRDFIVSYRAHGLPRPWPAITEDLERRIETMGCVQLGKFLYHNHRLSEASTRAGVGMLLGVISAAVEGRDTHVTPTRPLFSLVAAHDTTVLPILTAFDAWNAAEWPDFASWVAFELYDDGAVIMLFEGKEVRRFETVAAFESECLRLRPVKDWQSECAQMREDVEPLKPGTEFSW